MKIGLIIYGSLTTLSGGYLYDRMLIRELKRQGCQIDIISLPWRNYGLHLLDNLHRDLVRKIHHAQYDLLLQDELNHPSLFLLNERLRAGLPSGNSSADKRLPLVSIVHHLRSHETYPAYLKLLYRAVEKRYLRSVDAFLVNSWTTRRAVESLLAHERPFHVAYPAGDHLSSPDPTIVLRNIAAHKAGAPLRVAFVGNVISRKALHVVVESLDLLRRARPDLTVTLDVIGNRRIAPEYVRRVEQQVQKNNLEQFITFHDQVEAGELSRLLLQCQVMAVPSFEGFGIVYLEAMSHGLCPIAATGGAAQEIIRHGVNGLLVPPDTPTSLARQLAELAAVPMRLQAYRLAAQAHSRLFLSWEQSFKFVYLWLCEITKKRYP